jgi:hypothetical protein
MINDAQPHRHDDDRPDETSSNLDSTRDLDLLNQIASGVLDPVEELAAAKRALAPVQAAMTAAGFYAYGTIDDQNRWMIASDSEFGRVDVRLGSDGFTVELWNTSPGLFADEENEFRQRVLERVARMTMPRITQGLLEPNQSAEWDEVERGVLVRIAYDLPFGRGDEIGEFALEHLPELEELMNFVEQRVAS